MGFRGDQSEQETIGTESPEECMDACSAWRPRCYAMTFNLPDSLCRIQTNPALNNSAGGLLVDTKFNIAVADHSQLQTPSDLTCPGDRIGPSTPGGDDAFDVLCNKDFTGVGDFDPYNLDQYEKNPHADSLEDCINFCLRAHPFCNAVSWNVGLINGFGNCYIKSGLIASDATLAPSGPSTVHSAILARSVIQATDVCPDDSSYSASSGAEFEITCSTALEDSQNSTSIHKSSFLSCMDSCGDQQDDACLGVLFDIEMTEGYDNCYLLTDLGRTTTGVNTFAKKTNPGSSSPDQADGEAGSKAWIAGPVIGAVILLALIGFGFWWRSRRRKRKHLKPVLEPEAAAKLAPPITPTPQEVDGEANEVKAMLPSENERYELQDPKMEENLVHELDAGKR
jgi:hypothetical protein